MARIIEHIPDSPIVEICSNCKEQIKIITLFDCDDTPYPACENCNDVIENIWSGWKPKEKECPECLGLAKFFGREYGDAYYVYHKNHSCQCGHLHEINKLTCINKTCGCTKFISIEGEPALNFPAELGNP